MWVFVLLLCVILFLLYTKVFDLSTKVFHKIVFVCVCEKKSPSCGLNMFVSPEDHKKKNILASLGCFYYITLGKSGSFSNMGH